MSPFVSGILGKLIACLRWLFAKEELPVVADDVRDADQQRTNFARWLVGPEKLDGDQMGRKVEARLERLLHWILSSEALPEAPARAPEGVRTSLTFWRWITGGEELPRADERAVLEVSQTNRCRFLHHLLSADECPDDSPAPRRRRTGFARWLASPEECPSEKELSPRKGGGFWSWLLSREEL